MATLSRPTTRSCSTQRICSRSIAPTRTSASQRCRLPSRCSNSPKHGRGSRRRRWRPRGRCLATSPALLQGLIHEGIAKADLVLAPCELMKVPDVEALVMVAVQRQEPLHLVHGRALLRGRAAPPIVEIVHAVAFELHPHAPNAARTAAQDVGGLHPREPPGQHLQDHVATFMARSTAPSGYGMATPSATIALTAASGSGHFTCQKRPHHVSPTLVLRIP
jgi:hypothetical protein